MNPVATRIRRSQGSVLIGTTLISIAIIGISIASVLQLVGNRSTLMARSQSWNECMPILESGLEEALAHCIRNGNNLASAGWTLTNGQYSRTASVGEGFFAVRIIPGATNSFDIISAGCMPVPASPDRVARTVRITTLLQGSFYGAMVAKNYVDLKGNNVYTDSYDSRDATKSTGGFYDPAKRGDHGGIASVAGLVDSLSVGNADVYGHVWTGPEGTIAIKSTASVGSLGWHAAGSTGIQPEWWVNDLNMDLPDAVIPPVTTWSPPRTATKADNKVLSYSTTTTTSGPGSGKKNDSTTTVTYTDPVTGSQTNITTAIKTEQKTGIVSTNVTTDVIYTRIYDYVLENGDFTMPLMSKKVLVTGNATIYVTDQVKFTGSDFIEMLPGATLTIYNAGQNGVLGDIIHPAGMPPKNFQYYGLPSNTYLEVKGATDWSGLVYAPSADFKLAGNGTLYGGFVANSATLSGNATFHYDEALEMLLPARSFVVTSWNEL